MNDNEDLERLEEGTPRIPIIFRKTKEGDILALFPTLPVDRDSEWCACYSFRVNFDQADIKKIISETMDVNIDTNEHKKVLDYLTQMGIIHVVVYRRYYDWMAERRGAFRKDKSKVHDKEGKQKNEEEGRPNEGLA